MFPRGVSSEMPRESPTYLCCIKQWGKPISPFSWKAYHVLSGCLQRGRWRWVGLVAGRSHGRGRRGDDEIRGLGCREEEKISSRISLAKKGMGRERGKGDLCSLVSHGTLGGRRIATTKQGLGEGGYSTMLPTKRRCKISFDLLSPLSLLSTLCFCLVFGEIRNLEDGIGEGRASLHGRRQVSVGRRRTDQGEKVSRIPSVPSETLPARASYSKWSLPPPTTEKSPPFASSSSSTTATKRREVPTPHEDAELSKDRYQTPSLVNPSSTLQCGFSLRPSFPRRKGSSTNRVLFLLSLRFSVKKCSNPLLQCSQQITFIFFHVRYRLTAALHWSQ